MLSKCKMLYHLKIVSFIPPMITNYNERGTYMIKYHYKSPWNSLSIFKTVRVLEFKRTLIENTFTFLRYVRYKCLLIESLKISFCQKDKRYDISRVVKNVDSEARSSTYVF